MGDSYTFDFVDGPFPCTPAPGIAVVFKSGNYTWYQKQTAEAIRASHEWLLDHLDRHGPYDAVCCFSQGCALVISLLLYHARENPDQPLPFKAALFICGGIPLPVLTNLGLPVSQKAREIGEQTVKLLHQRAANLERMAANPDLIKRGVGLWDDTTGLVHDPDVIPEASDVFGLDFTAFPDDVRIDIPTAHVYGAKDPRWPASMQLAFACENRQMYDHGGGHDIPRSTEVSKNIAEMVRQLRRQID